VQPFSPPAAALELVYGKIPGPGSDLELSVSDPDSAVRIAENMGLTVVEERPGGRAEDPARRFRLVLPGGTTLGLRGRRDASGSEPFGVAGNLDARGKAFVVVVSRFNSFITERLLSGAVDGLRRAGAGAKDVEIVRVPGAFEIASAARMLARSKKYHAIVCIGCLLRGDTAHYDVIVNEVARGIGQSAQETGVPHAFGVLTCDTLEQAIDRAGLKMGNKGFEAALAAVEMASLKSAVVSSRARGRAKVATVSPAGRGPARTSRARGKKPRPASS
jgi:6,7-dimethyl-8-ribityllumazine synthase